MHILIKALGGKVEKANYREYGKADIKLKKNSILFKNIYSKNSSINVWMSHGDSVTKTPQGVNVIASNKSTPVIAFSFKKNIFGLQFHPEVTHTNQGKKIIHNYLFEVCKTKKLWTIRKIEKNLIDDIKNTVGNKKVILGLSGGVDSSVSAVLIHKAIGSQLKCVFVDTGLIRINEKEDVKNLFVKNLNIKVDFVNAKNKFYDSLSNITDPETKEKLLENALSRFLKIT